MVVMIFGIVVGLDVEVEVYRDFWGFDERYYNFVVGKVIVVRSEGKGENI